MLALIVIMALWPLIRNLSRRNASLIDLLASLHVKRGRVGDKQRYCNKVSSVSHDFGTVSGTKLLLQQNCYGSTGPPN